MKFLISAMGSGETSQGYALARYLVTRQHQVVLALQQESSCMYCAPSPDLSITFAPTIEMLRERVNVISPDAVILCNSKMFNQTSFVDSSPWRGLPTFGLDTNWLFDADGIHRCIQWLDTYFVAFPEPLFKLGYEEYGGHFLIPPHMHPRIKPVGFIPSYQKLDEPARRQVRNALGIQDHEQLIFCYISGYGGSTLKAYVLENLFQVVARLRRQGRAIKILAVGKLDLFEQNPAYHADWLLFQKSATTEEFYRLLASADLVFQQQGHGTMAQAIAAEVPVIANVEIRADEQWSPIGVFEVMAFQQAGLCHMFFNHSPLDAIQQSVESLLYDAAAREDMQQLHKQHYLQGEAGIHAALIEYLSAKTG